MSFQVDKALIKRFREDRALLPYDDIAIATKMGVDRSNYSKAVNKGPITSAFLRKFYYAFRDELTVINGRPNNDRYKFVESGSNDLLQLFGELLAQVDRLIVGQKELREQFESMERELDIVMEKAQNRELG